MSTVVVLNPDQFLNLSPLEIQEIANESEKKQTKEVAAKPNGGSPAVTETIQQVELQRNEEMIVKPSGREEKSKKSSTKKQPIVSNPPVEKGKVIDVEGNNAKSSFHLCIVIAFIMAFFCLIPFAFIPFTIVYLRFRSNPTESPQVYAFSERSRWIALGILFSNMVMLLVASMIVLIVLFSAGIIRR